MRSRMVTSWGARSDPAAAHSLDYGYYRGLRAPRGLHARGAREYGRARAERGYTAFRRLLGLHKRDKLYRSGDGGNPWKHRGLVGRLLYRPVGWTGAVVALRALRRCPRAS